MNRPRESRTFESQQGLHGDTGKGETSSQGLHDSKAHPSAEDVPDERDPHTEKNLDHGLKETFPASDPVSISPGAD